MGLYKHGKTWYLDYRYPPSRQGKRIREKIGPVSKDEAMIVLSTRLKDMAVGRNPELRKIAPIPFKQMAAEFLERHARKLKSYRSIKREVDTLLKHFAEKTLQEITPKAIEDFVSARLASGVGKSTTNRQRSWLSKMFNCAIDWGYFGGENPVRRVKAFKEPSGRVRFLSADEAEALIEHAPAHLRPIILCALYTGGRLSEVLGLRWQDVPPGGPLYFDATNTKSGKQREIPIHARLAAVLQEQRKRRFTGGDARLHVFTWGGKRVKSVRTAFNGAREDAGLEKAVTFHTLRHTFASWYMINGGDLYRLKEYLGHSTIELTQRYAHLSPEHRREGVQFFGAPAAIGGQTVDNTIGSAQNAGPANA